MLADRARAMLGLHCGIVGIPIAVQVRLRVLAVERAAGPLKPAPDSIGVVGALQLVDQEGQPVQPGGHDIGALPLAPGVATHRNCTNPQQAGEKGVVNEHLADGLPFGARRWAVLEPLVDLRQQPITRFCGFRPLIEPLAGCLRADSLAQQGLHGRFRGGGLLHDAHEHQPSEEPAFADVGLPAARQIGSHLYFCYVILRWLEG